MQPKIFTTHGVDMAGELQSRVAVVREQIDVGQSGARFVTGRAGGPRDGVDPPTFAQPELTTQGKNASAFNLSR